MTKITPKAHEKYAELMKDPEALDEMIKSATRDRKILGICSIVICLSSIFVKNANLGFISISIVILLAYELKFQILNIVKAISEKDKEKNL